MEGYFYIYLKKILTCAQQLYRLLTGEIPGCEIVDSAFLIISYCGFLPAVPWTDTTTYYEQLGQI
jgi:hypothetical protein